MRFNIIARYTGLVLILNAVFMLISAFVALLQGDESVLILLLSAGITGMLGVFPLIFVTPAKDISAKEGTGILAFSWLASCLCGMLPYLFWGDMFSLSNAWFESVSGYTTTGATILTDVEKLPDGLLFWRSATHWIGGMGVVLMLVLILPSMRNLKLRLAKTEISSLSKGNYKFRVQQTARVISGMYVGMTLLQTILLMFAGMGWFDAINHSFSTISTGGFSTRTASIWAFDSAWIEGIITVFMVIAGMHFGLLYMAFRGDYKPLWKSSVIRFYLSGLLIGSVAVALNLWQNGTYGTIGEALRYGAFQVISTCTTTGFATADTALWSTFAMLILFYFMFQCACSGSTAGGVKADRIWILFKSIQNFIRKQQHPNAIIPVRSGGVSLNQEVVSSAVLYIATYILLVFIGAILLSFVNNDIMTSFSASLACLGNVGPGFGSVGAMSNYADIHFFGKFVLTIEMLFGRLEIYGLLLVFFVRSWK